MKAILLLPLIGFLISCSNADQSKVELSKPELSPADIALQVTEDRFNSHIDIVEVTKDKNSKIREFNTAYKDKLCDVAINTETLEVTKMVCKDIPSNIEKQIDKVFTEKGKAEIKKMESEIASNGKNSTE